MARIKIVVTAEADLPDGYQVIQDFTPCSEAAQDLTANGGAELEEQAAALVAEAIEQIGLPAEITSISTALSIGCETKVTSRRLDEDGQPVTHRIENKDGDKIPAGTPETLAI